MQPHGVLETVLYAPDLAAAEAFYRDVLGLDLVSTEPGRHVFFRCGKQMVLVFDPETTSTKPHEMFGSLIPLHGAQGAGHVAFAVKDAELDDWRARLRKAGIAIESEISWPQGGQSVYFRDPAGNSLELATPTLWGLSED